MINKTILSALLFSTLVLGAQTAATAKPAGFDSSDVKTRGVFSMDKAKRGGTVRAAVVIDIPDGYHVNSNQPLSKFAIGTQLRVTGPRGVRTGPVSYPRGSVKSFSFSKEKLSVFEGRAVLRFTVTVLPNYNGDAIDLETNLRFQSCTNEV